MISTLFRGIYNVQDADFNLSQFGMFLQNDTLFLTVHLNDIVERIGRKPMSGMYRISAHEGRLFVR